MRNTRLADKIKVVQAAVPAVVGVGAVTPVEVVGTGYDRALYIVYTGATGAGASTMSFKIQDAAPSGGALADLPNAVSAGLTKAAHANKVEVYDVPVNPARPFQKVTAAVGTDTWAVAVICVLYKGKNYPVAASYAAEAVVI
jgi:hypothetical protein